MRTLLLCALSAGCAGTEQASTEAPPAPATATAPASQGPTNEDLLKSPPPELGGYGKVLSKAAEHFGVGLVRCPLVGGGRARVIYGTERDQLQTNGPMWSLEIDPATDPPWDVVFDEVVSEDDWVTFLAVPGATTGQVATKARVTGYEFPPAAAGQVTVCTAVRELKPRTVKGKVNGMANEHAFVVPCLAEEKRTGADGTFVTEVPTPCKLWVESPPMRTEKVSIEPGDGPLEIELTLQPDVLQGADRSWSPEGLKAVVAAVERADQAWIATNGWLEQLRTELAGDSGAARAIHRYSYEHTIWGRAIERNQATLDVAQGKTPRKMTRVESPVRPN